MDVYVVIYQLQRTDPYTVEGVFKNVEDAKLIAETLTEHYASCYSDFCVEMVRKEIQ